MKRIDDLLGRMTLEEKVYQMENKVPAIVMIRGLEGGNYQIL